MQIGRTRISVPCPINKGFSRINVPNSEDMKRVFDTSKQVDVIVNNPERDVLLLRDKGDKFELYGCKHDIEQKVFTKPEIIEKLLHYYANGFSFSILHK